MNASNPAAHSALWFLEPATGSIKQREGAQQAFAVIFMDMAVVGQEGAGVLQLLGESRKNARVFMGAGGGQGSGAVPKSKPVENALEGPPAKNRPTKPDSKKGLAHTGCYAH